MFSSTPLPARARRQAAARGALVAMLGAVAVGLGAPGGLSAQLVRSGAGANATTARDQFRVDLGGGLVAGANGLFTDGTGTRREVNWDGVGAAASAPNNLPANFFNTTSPRGVVFGTPGTGFQVSGATNDGLAGQPAAANFGNIDPSSTTTFLPFSPQRLFTALGSNIVDVNFFVPGSNTPGLVRGFGSIFSDVDLANATSIQYFDANGASLGTFFAPVGGAANQTFSFLGVSFATASISRVRITNGNAALGAGVTDQNGDPRDLVVMDDFLYSEPIGISAVPEPATLGLVGIGLLAIGAPVLRRRRSS